MSKYMIGFAVVFLSLLVCGQALSAPGGPPANWDTIINMPAGFSDGVDDGAGSATIEDTAYPTGWDADTVNGASQNAIYDVLQLFLSLSQIGAAYDTAAELDALFAAKQDASTAFTDTEAATHAGAADPHTGYQLESGMSAYQPVVTEGVLADDTVVEADLKFVNAATDEYCMTYEATTGDFEWQACGSGYTNLTSFVSQTAWRIFYSNTDGDVTELALGADGTYLMSNGASVAPTFETPAGSGDMTSVGPYASGDAFADGAVSSGTTMLTWEGTTADTYEFMVAAPSADPAADVTVTMPSTTGTIALNPMTTAGDIVYGGASGAETRLAAGSANYLLGMNSGGTAPEWKSQLTLQFAASAEFEGSTADAYETTLSVTDPTADRTITLPDSTGTVLLADGSGASLTAIPLDADFGSNGIMERTAAGVYGIATAGTDYIAPNGVATLTTGTLNVPSSNADPATTAGQLRHDSTVTNYTNGALRFYDGTNIRHALSMVAATAEGCTDDQVAAYDAAADVWYCKDDAGAAGGDSVSIDSVGVVDPDFVSTGDIDFVDTSNTVTANLNADVVDEAHIADDGIDSEHYNDGSVDSVHISTIVESIAWNAGGISADGTQCDDATRTTINSGPVDYTIICADSDTSSMYGHVLMPDSWDGGTVTMELEYLQTAADTSALNADVAMQCRGTGETVSSTWGTEIAIDDAAVTGSNATDHTTSAAVTPAGTCAGGDTLYWRIQLDATGTTTAVATLHFLGTKMEYTSNVGD